MRVTGWSQRSIAIVVAATVPGPPDVVWRLITDWERQGEWMLEARDFVVTSAHREGTGVEAEATVRIGGISTRDRIRVTGWNPPRRLSLEHVGWVSGSGDLLLIPVGARETRVVWREALCAPRLGPLGWLGPVGWLGLLLFRPLMRRIFRRDLRVLADVVARA
ncbi:MAG TPA: SRPBCC family protein [Actinomycetes bacterium]|nr:SRPBCC family protein [Actinomycetes bacterium]